MLIIVIALASCGQAAKAHANATAVRGGPFASLLATRTSEFPRNNIPAFDHTGTDPAAIAKLSDAIAAPKPYPANADYFCPLDLGLFYHLTFTRADGTQVTGEAKPDGCEYAGLSSGPRGAIVDFDTFWSLFAAALGVAPSALHYQP